MAFKLRKGPPPAEAPPAETSPPPSQEVTDEKSLRDMKRRIHAAALQRGMIQLVTRTNAVNLALVVLLSIVAVIFLLSMMQKGIGNFTISLSRTDMYKYGIEMSANPEFYSASSRLEADSLPHATNISVNDLPFGLETEDGSHNGQNYIAYTFYVRNNGTSDFDYRYEIDIQEVTMELDSAIRVAVYYNGGEREVFAKKAAVGGPEPDTIPFATDHVIDAGTILDMAIGSVDKYTIVIWVEGDDPECTDDRLGGVIKLAMNIQVIMDEENQ